MMDESPEKTVPFQAILPSDWPPSPLAGTTVKGKLAGAFSSAKSPIVAAT
jgi:hypothetical protein